MLGLNKGQCTQQVHAVAVPAGVRIQSRHHRLVVAEAPHAMVVPLWPPDCADQHNGEQLLHHYLQGHRTLVPLYLKPVGAVPRTTTPCALGVRCQLQDWQMCWGSEEGDPIPPLNEKTPPCQIGSESPIEANGVWPKGVHRHCV